MHGNPRAMDDRTSKSKVDVPSNRNKKRHAQRGSCVPRVSLNKDCIMFAIVGCLAVLIVINFTLGFWLSGQISKSWGVRGPSTRPRATDGNDSILQFLRSKSQDANDASVATNQRAAHDTKEERDSLGIRVYFEPKRFPVTEQLLRFFPDGLTSTGDEKDEDDILQFGSLGGGSSFKRTIAEDDAARYESYRKSQLVDSNPAVDSFSDPYRDVEAEGECRRQSWYSLMFPTCNALHEVTLDRPRGSLCENDYKWVGEGTFRQTFILGNADEQQFAMKTLLYKNRFHSFLRQQLYSVPLEALILERLTSSPRITDIYGFCGATSIIEAMPVDISTIIQDGRGYATPSSLDDLEDVNPRNKFTPWQKAKIALVMAEAVADLHGYSGGAIVHGDNHIEQFLANKDGEIKLGDFNLATVLEWNGKKGEYCKREREPWQYRFRAPEEMSGTPFDDKIDVFSFGNNIYSLITGLRPFYENHKAKQVCAQILNGTRGYVDPRYRKRTDIESQLLQTLDLVWEGDGDKRVDIFSVVEMLRGIVKNVAHVDPAELYYYGTRQAQSSSDSEEAGVAAPDNEEADVAVPDSPMAILKFEV